MKNLLTRLIYLAITAKLMVACAVLPTADSVSRESSLQNQRTASARLALSEMEDIDSLIKLDNRWLESQIKAELNEQASLTGQYNFRRLSLDFVRQTIAMDAVVDIRDKQANEISASVNGEIILDFNGAQLEWLPRFSHLRISSGNLIFADGASAEPAPELTQETLQNLQSEIADALIQRGGNTIPLDVIPLGDIRVGASLPELSRSPAMKSQELRGVFMVAGSTMLIDSSDTTIALDMAFIPDLSNCPADVSVSRAEFANQVVSREPVGIVRSLNAGTEASYFYSEIKGAKRPLTIIHYWFADGLPVTVEELAVGPSERWRTWSGKGLASSDARRWEVLVVEKESGCILHSQTIRTLESETIITQANLSQARQAFKAFGDELKLKTAGFTIVKDRPEIALLEVRRPFFRDVLQAALADLSIEAEFDSTALSALEFSANLQPFDVEAIACESRACPPTPICKAVLTQCNRLRDTRECASCKFRNPLNNRCISEAIDPICEASRNRQNERYETARLTCIADAEAAKRECEQLAAQAAESCQIESGFEGSACEAIKTSMKALRPGTPLATLGATSHTSGSLSASFNRFRIEGDLESLKLDLTLNSGLRLDGKLKFSPSSVDPALVDCISAWSAPFSKKFVATRAVNNLLSPLEPADGSLTANWSGFGLTVETNPSPLESVFISNPQLLANCKMGLTVNQVEEAVTGDDSRFFTGHIELEILPLPTVINLAPATLGSGNVVHSAEAKLSAHYLRFDIGD